MLYNFLCLRATFLFSFVLNNVTQMFFFLFLMTHFEQVKKLTIYVFWLVFTIEHIDQPTQRVCL